MTDDEQEIEIDPSQLMQQLEASAKSIKSRAKQGTTSAGGVMKELSGTVMPALLKLAALVGNHAVVLGELGGRVDELEDVELQSQLLPEDAQVILDALTLCRPLAEIEDQASTLAAIDKAIQLVNEVVLLAGEEQEDEDAAPVASTPEATPPPAPPADAAPAN